MLTKKQHDLLVYIHNHMSGSDVAPSFEEMKEALGLKSKSGIHRLIRGLEERGYLQRLPHRARALEIIKLPEGLSSITPAPANTDEGQQDVRPQNIEISGMMEVPLCGKIAAGTPIEAIQHEGPMVGVPEGLMSHGEHYALMVEGDSMINAGIHDQDIVIIKKCDSAENGTIVVALVDDEEATLKRLRRSGSKIILEPENDTYEPQVFDPDRVKIQGRIISLMRSYH